MIEISASLLPLKIDEMVEYANETISLGVHRLHLDIIDGKFVNQKGLPDDVVKEIIHKYHSKIKIDAHLMVVDPNSYIEKEHYKYLNTIYIHHQKDQQALKQLKNKISALGCQPGLVINPDEPIISEENKYFNDLLIMGVVPGLSGQKMLPNTYDRLKVLNTHYQQSLNKPHITLDGGVTASDLDQLNGQLNCCVMGSAIFDKVNWQNNLKQMLVSVK